MGAQASFAEGMRAAKEVQKDLQWTQKRVEYVQNRYSSKSFLKLIDFPVHSTTELRANIPNSSEPLSDDTQHRSTTRSLDHKIRHTALLMIHTYTFRFSVKNPAAFVHSRILSYFSRPYPLCILNEVLNLDIGASIRLSSTSPRSTPLHPSPAASLL